MKNKKNLKTFLKNYLDLVYKKAIRVEIENLFQAVNLITKTIKKNKTIFMCGNGGSAAIANHYVCDYFKQLSKYTNLTAKIRSLNSDNYLISAIANDISYDQIFKKQFERYHENGDILILISSSGNSKNIIEITKFCKRKKIKTIGFTNFSGGYLKNNCDISIHSNVSNYGVGEDINHIFMHMIMQFITFSNLNKNYKKIII